MRHEPTSARPPEVIELRRLRLRRPRLSDATAIFEYASDPEVARFADWPISSSVESVTERLRGRESAWSAGTEFNVASARVLEKAGLTREGVLRQAIIRPNLSDKPRDAFSYSKVRDDPG